MMIILRRINPRYVINKKKSSMRYDRNGNEENSKLTKTAVAYIWYTFSCNIWHSYFTSGLNDLCMHCRRLYLHVSVRAIHTGKCSGAQVTRGARWPREFPTPAWFYACILFALTGGMRGRGGGGRGRTRPRFYPNKYMYIYTYIHICM